MSERKPYTKIDLLYIKPGSTFIRPLYNLDDNKVLDARTVLTKELIDSLINKYGNIFQFHVKDKDFKAVIPHYRVKIAYNNAKNILDEIEKTDKLSKAGFKEAEKVIEDILNDLYSIDVEEIDLLKELNDFDEYLYNHSVNVGIMTALFARKINKFSDDELKSVSLGAYLIDIGQKKIDRQLLNKEGKYDISEFQKIKRHPQLGYEIIKNVNDKDAILLQSILFHHEKYNNNGYYQLPYVNLPIYPKLIAVCDIYDALTTKRPYRKDPLSPKEAMKAIVNTTNLISDKKIVENFVNLMSPVLNGTTNFIEPGEICELNSQELALIKKIDYDKPLKPTVQIFCKFERTKKGLSVVYYKQIFEIDLQNDKRFITKILNNEKQISAIKKSLIEKNLLE